MPPSIKVNGPLIRSLREQSGIERIEMARLAGVSYQTVYVLEKKREITSPSTLRKIAEVLGVRPEQLVADRVLVEA